jgi:hypothetical protein
MKRFLWTLAAISSAVAWLGAFAQLLTDRGMEIATASPIGFGMFLIHCGAVWLALRLRARLHATGSGSEVARFDRPGTSFAFRMTGALAVALSICAPALIVAWVRPLFG